MSRHRWRVNPAYTVTERVLTAIRKASPIGLAVIRGDHEEADRLRWERYPELMRARELAASVGMPAPKARRRKSQPAVSPEVDFGAGI